MSAALPLDAAPSLVDVLLAEQRRLRAVDEFSAWDEAGEAHAGRYETLIPQVSPGEGRQLAFAVDLDACTGCKACVTACHSLNGLEPGETWRRTGEIEGAGRPALRTGEAFRQTITSSCHHCEDPACAAGCPVQAYEKDPTTGIVIHLDDQCIGCRYCQLTCPYEVPQFSERLGVVRKCDMCHERLAAGEAPACVQGCPNGAISIEIVEVAGTVGASPARAAAEASPSPGSMLLPVVDGGMPLSSLTRPTTRYRSERGLPAGLEAVEGASPRPAASHDPLAVMLVLTQASVGALLFDGLFAALAPDGAVGSRTRLISLLVAAVLGLGGLAASVFHLGRPQWAFRAFLGLRTSWMSREIVAFGGFAAALVAALGSTGAGQLDPESLGREHAVVAAFVAGLDPVLRASAIAAGLAGLVCSVGIYAVTGRPLWRADRTALRFGCTALLLGAAVAAVAWNVGGVGQGSTSSAGALGGAAALACVPLAVFVLKVALEQTRLVRGNPGFDEVALARTRTLLAGALASGRHQRLGLGVLGVAAIALAGWIPGAASGSVQSGPFGPALAWIGLVACIAGEIAERRLFFTGEAMRGMPGPSTGRSA